MIKLLKKLGRFWGKTSGASSPDASPGREEWRVKAESELEEINRTLAEADLITRETMESQDKWIAYWKRMGDRLDRRTASLQELDQKLEKLQNGFKDIVKQGEEQQRRGEEMQRQAESLMKRWRAYEAKWTQLKEGSPDYEVRKRQLLEERKKLEDELEGYERESMNL